MQKVKILCDKLIFTLSPLSSSFKSLHYGSNVINIGIDLLHNKCLQFIKDLAAWGEIILFLVFISFFMCLLLLFLFFSKMLACVFVLI